MKNILLFHIIHQDNSNNEKQKKKVRNESIYVKTFIRLETAML